MKKTTLLLILTLLMISSCSRVTQPTRPTAGSYVVDRSNTLEEKPDEKPAPANLPAEDLRDPFIETVFKADPPAAGSKEPTRITFLNTGVPAIIWTVLLAVVCPECDPFRIVK